MMTLTVHLPGKPPLVREFSGSEVTIGRAAGNHLVINHTSVSSKHARIEVLEGMATLEDLGSTNGVYLGDRKVKQVELGIHTEVFLGEARIEVEFDASSRETTQVMSRPPGGLFQGRGFAVGALFGGLLLVGCSIALDWRLSYSDRALSQVLQETLAVLGALVVVGLILGAWSKMQTRRYQLVEIMAALFIGAVLIYWVLWLSPLVRFNTGPVMSGVWMGIRVVISLFVLAMPIQLILGHSRPWKVWGTVVLLFGLLQGGFWASKAIEEREKETNLYEYESPISVRILPLSAKGHSMESLFEKLEGQAKKVDEDARAGLDFLMKK